MIGWPGLGGWSPRVGAAASALVVAVVAALLGACGPEDEREIAPLRVYAAASLTEAFQEVAGAFEAEHPEADVTLIFGGSQRLRLQISHGADADVFASAHLAHLDALVDQGVVAKPRTFARNTLVVITPLDDPAGVGVLADLADAERLVVAHDQVPAGMYTEALFERARASLGEDLVAAIRDRIVSKESSVRLVRAKVELGEADAALVYRSDAVASDRVRRVELPEGLRVAADYGIARIRRSSRSELARRFVAFVRSEAGQSALARHGFGRVDE